MNDLDALLRGGVVGGGGAGFPAWKKLSSPARTLIINGAECEPLLRSDQYLMLHEAEPLVRAAQRLKELVGAEEAIIALKDHYHPQLEALAKAIHSLKLDIVLKTIPTVYPIGDEQAVVHACTGKAVPPRGLPGQVGCTVVSVSTALNALKAFEGVPVTRRLLTVAGEVHRPGLYDVPVGTPVSRVLEAAGGASSPDVRLMLGGPMMGLLVPQGEDPSVTKTCGGVLVLPEDHLLVRYANLSLSKMQARARACCIQCRQCTDLCPRYLLGHPIHPHLTMRAFGMGSGPEPSAALCMECGVCELYACPMGLNPRRVQQLHKEKLRSTGAEIPSFSSFPTQQELQAIRQVPSARMAARIDVEKYEFKTPASVLSVHSDWVRIPLKQHIGAPAQAVVKPGDHVSAGQTIGRMAQGSLGADCHASITGIVEKAEDAITIRGEGRE